MIVGGVRKFMVKASFGIPDYSSAYWPKLLGRTRTVMDKIAATKEVSDELSQGGLDAPTNNVMTGDPSRKDQGQDSVTRVEHYCSVLGNRVPTQGNHCKCG